MLSLTIAGKECIHSVEAGTLEIEQALTYEVDTCTFSYFGEQPEEGEEIVVSDMGKRFFAGIIDKVELNKSFPHSSLKIWKVECTDYTSLLDRRLAVESYTNVGADEIFRDIVLKYCPGFTVKGVRSGAPLVEDIIFDYVPISECFKQLCDYVGWHWQPDYHKDLQFFSAEELAQPAPIVLAPGGPFRLKKHTISTQGLRNRVYVRGGSMLSDPYTYEIRADGVARTWILPHAPTDLTFNLGEAAPEDGDNKNAPYFVNTKEKYVRCSNRTVTPTEGTTLTFIYKYDIEILTAVEDLESQQALAKVQGNDGVYEHIITDDSLTTVEAAEAAGLADLREHANPKINGEFETEIPGWETGQIIKINLPHRGIEGEFLIQKISMSIIQPGTWLYKVKYGGRLLGIADFLKALVSAQQKKDTGKSVLLHKLQTCQEKVFQNDTKELTSRKPPWVCGDSDAICGFVHCW